MDYKYAVVINQANCSPHLTYMCETKQIAYEMAKEEKEMALERGAKVFGNLKKDFCYQITYPKNHSVVEYCVSVVELT